MNIELSAVKDHPDLSFPVQELLDGCEFIQDARWARSTRHCVILYSHDVEQLHRWLTLDHMSEEDLDYWSLKFDLPDVHEITYSASTSTLENKVFVDVHKKLMLIAKNSMEYTLGL